jgi:hypothetical protein
MATYRVKGTTGDIIRCEQCGRDDLRKTVVLATLDADGNEQEIVHFGVDCAARATGTRQAAIRIAAAAADHRLGEARAWAAEALAIFPTMTVEAYIAANRYFADRPIVEAKTSLAATIAEARQIADTGDITDTRFDRRPTKDTGDMT